ncbi:hypothetical protein BX600DRAFT_55050 [Xylariales sp. PMI_506]|nr:hypothetical protein BX600DRAFT_55050 [Xylariales sp. PMI_506]
MASTAAEYEVSAMPQLYEARIKDDVWTGMASPAERRRRQNRLNQRAWRRRKEQQQRDLSNSQSPETAVEADFRKSSTQYARSFVAVPPIDTHVSLWVYLYNQLQAPHGGLEVDRSSLLTFSQWDEIRRHREAGFPKIANTHDQEHSKDAQRQIIPPVIPYLPPGTPYARLAPSQFTFPLSPDHQLLVLVQLNVLRGSLVNMALLNNLNRIPQECSAALAMRDLPTAPETPPLSLRPTVFQQAADHDLWIDSVPWPQMRDNLIRHQAAFDHDEFCSDVSGGLFEGFNYTQTHGVIIWGEPWSEDGWELTDGFVKKWNFLLEGCDQLIEATNRWRDLRGDPRIDLGGRVVEQL